MTNIQYSMSVRINILNSISVYFIYAGHLKYCTETVIVKSLNNQQNVRNFAGLDI